jgi:hypothetical protein
MVDYLQMKNLKSEDFKRLTGVTKKIYLKMVAIVKIAGEEKQKKGVRKRKVTYYEIIGMMLEYWREYRTYFHIGIAYNISEGYCCRLIRWAENVLKNSGEFDLKGKEYLEREDAEDEDEEIIIVDATELKIQRPTKNQEENYSGKKKPIHVRRK